MKKPFRLESKINRMKRFNWKEESDDPVKASTNTFKSSKTASISKAKNFKQNITA